MNIESAIGIDLGTTNSCVAVVINGVAEVISNEYKERTTPSVVSIFENGTRYVGKQAKDAQYKNLQNTIYESKRLIGRKFDEECVQDRMFHWPFKVIEDNGNPKISIKVKKPQLIEKFYYPEEISGMVLEKMKSIAEDFVGFEITKAVVTVPAYFNDNQRQATIDAAKIAGLDVLKIINEPTAATFSYILKNNIKHVCNTLVFDLGGGTLDVSIINSNGEDFIVLAVNGDPDLGGADFDILLYNEIVSVINRKANHYGTFQEDQRRRILANCIKVKEQLSHSLKARFDLSELLPNFDFEHEFTRTEFEKLASHLIKRIMAVVKKSVKEAQMSPSDIDNIVIVGGCSKIPAVKQSLEEFFKKELSFAVNPDEAVACGAAYQAAILNGQTANLRNISVVDVTPFSLGLETDSINMDVVIKKNSPLPTKYTKVYTTMLDNQTALRIIIYQGENKLTANNIKLGYFDLIGIPPLPARIPKILVTFDINTNGVLQVTATETSSKETNQVEIVTNTGRITNDDLNQIKKQNQESLRKQKISESFAKEKNDALKFCFELKRIVTNSKTIGIVRKNNFIQDVDKSIKLIEGLAIDNATVKNLENEKTEIQTKYFKLITGS